MKVFRAKVIRGKGRGSKMGLPTINLDAVDLNIEQGVYLVRVNEKYSGLMHFGHKKTFNEGISTEILVREYIQDIGSREIEIEIIKKIRDIRKFKSMEDLQIQIERDLKFLR